MTRLIDADELLKELEDWNADLQSDSILYGLSTTERQLGITDAIVIACQMPTPTVDAVPVIRCKDCKYYSYGTVEGKHLCMSVKYRFTPTAENEWCSRAERKEE